MRVVVLKFADPKGCTPIQRMGSKAAFRMQFPNADYFPLYRKMPIDKWIDCRRACERARKIVVDIHGSYDSTDTGWIFSDGTNEVTRDVTWLGETIQCLMPPDREQTVMLIMCYGARSENYRQNHRRFGSLRYIVDLKTSFAYKFLKILCKSRTANLRLTAWTGSVQPTLFALYCETERSVRAEVKLDDLYARLHDVQQRTLDELAEIDKQGRPERDKQKCITEYKTWKKKWKRKVHRQKASTGKTTTNYGKLEYLFTADDSRVRIRTIYPRKRCVYDGAL